jgi:phage baseplate assembly protein V
MKVLVEMMERIARLEQRAAHSSIHGTVEQVDAKKQLVRLKLGETEGKPYLSPWVPYGQFAGKLKIHTPPTKGQNMAIFSPTGDPEQGVVMPFTFNKAFASPSQEEGENVMTFPGGVKAVVKEGHVFFSVGGSSITITAGNITIKSASVTFTKG